MEAMAHSVEESGVLEKGQEKSFGPVAAAFLAAGIGALVLGLATTLAEANESISNAFKWSSAVGPLSGKTIIAVAAWLASWAILHPMLAKRQVSERVAYWATGFLVALGPLLTFPIFFDLFSSS